MSRTAPAPAVGGAPPTFLRLHIYIHLIKKKLIGPTHAYQISFTLNNRNSD